MPIGLDNSIDIEIPGAPVTAAESPGIDIINAQKVSLPLVPTNKLDPRSEAGVTLTKIVLGIVSVALIVLLLFFGLQENRFEGAASQGYDFAVERLNESSTSPLQGILADVKAIGNNLRAPDVRPRLEAVAAKLSIVKSSVKDAAQSTSIDGLITNFRVLSETPKESEIDATKAHAAIASTEFLAKATQPVGTVEEMKTRVEILNSYSQFISSTRESWHKAAQMILLNLLLPLVTALLGYVFASNSSRTE